jgi:hemolysin activation/secretion protein
MAMKWLIAVMVVPTILLGTAPAANAQRDPADRSLRLDEDAIRTDIRRDRLEQTQTPPLAPQPSQVAPKAKVQTKPKRTGSGNQP